MPRVSVAIALPGRQEVIELELPEGATVRDALAAEAVRARFPAIAAGKPKVGIWSRAASPATVLREGDRVEVYRALAADPKAARRARSRLRASTRSRSGP